VSEPEIVPLTLGIVASVIISVTCLRGILLRLTPSKMPPITSSRWFELQHIRVNEKLDNTSDYRAAALRTLSSMHTLTSSPYRAPCETAGINFGREVQANQGREASQNPIIVIFAPNWSAVYLCAEKATLIAGAGRSTGPSGFINLKWISWVACGILQRRVGRVLL
jgi:hypothetical protein